MSEFQWYDMIDDIIWLIWVNFNEKTTKLNFLANFIL